MGANIGQNVKIHKDAKLGQADLLSIGRDVSIDNCCIRSFAIEEGHFVLLPISIGGTITTSTIKTKKLRTITNIYIYNMLNNSNNNNNNSKQTNKNININNHN